MIGSPSTGVIVLPRSFVVVVNLLDTMRALASKGEVVTLQTGDVLFRSGEMGTSMYGILEGTIRLTWTAKMARTVMRTSRQGMSSVQEPW